MGLLVLVLGGGNTVPLLDGNCGGCIGYLLLCKKQPHARRLNAVLDVLMILQLGWAQLESCPLCLTQDHTCHRGQLPRMGRPQTSGSWEWSWVGGSESPPCGGCSPRTSRNGQVLIKPERQHGCDFCRCGHREAQVMGGRG